MTLKIQVLGKGLIPRGLGLAPRMEPFPADMNLIATILQTPGLKVNYMTAQGQMAPLTQKNIKKVFDAEKARMMKAQAAAMAARKVARPVVHSNSQPTPPTGDPDKGEKENGEKKDEIPPHQTMTPPPAPPASEPEKVEENKTNTPPAAPAPASVKEPESVKPTTPVNPQTPPAPPKTEEPKVEEKKEEKKDSGKKPEETKTPATPANNNQNNVGSIKPVHAPEKK